MKWNLWSPSRTIPAKTRSQTDSGTHPRRTWRMEITSSFQPVIWMIISSAKSRKTQRGFRGHFWCLYVQGQHPKTTTLWVWPRRNRCVGLLYTWIVYTPETNRTSSLWSLLCNTSLLPLCQNRDRTYPSLAGWHSYHSSSFYFFIDWICHIICSFSTAHWDVIH